MRRLKDLKFTKKAKMVFQIGAEANIISRNGGFPTKAPGNGIVVKQSFGELLVDFVHRSPPEIIETW